MHFRPQEKKIGRSLRIGYIHDWDTNHGASISAPIFILLNALSVESEKCTSMLCILLFLYYYLTLSSLKVRFFQRPGCYNVNSNSVALKKTCRLNLKACILSRTCFLFLVSTCWCFDVPLLHLETLPTNWSSILNWSTSSLPLAMGHIQHATHIL